jgi:hypothetical protein
MINDKAFGGSVRGLILRHYNAIRLERLRKMMKYLSQTSGISHVSTELLYITGATIVRSVIKET